MKVALALIWGVIVTVISVNSLFMLLPIGLVIAWLPLYLARSGVKKDAAEKSAMHSKLMAEQGVALGKGFDHTAFGTGIGLNPEAQTVTLHVAGKWKTYPYSDIRRTGWEGSQFVIGVKDAENPVWRIYMQEEPDRERWTERFRQEILDR